MALTIQDCWIPYSPAYSHCMGLGHLGRALTAGSVLYKNADDTENACKVLSGRAQKEIQTLQLHLASSFLLTFL